MSLNTAVAARVGKNRITHQPESIKNRESINLLLRVDGKLTTLGPSGLVLDSGGHIEKTNDSGGLKIDFPDETVLRVTPGWWDSQHTWYLNVEAIRPPVIDGEDGNEDNNPEINGVDGSKGKNDATIRSEKNLFTNTELPHRRGAQTQGLMAAIPTDSWLPELPNGRTLGLMPASVPERFEQLYHQFGEAWRVNAYTSLFDYAPGTSTETFTNRKWPQLNGSCQVPNKTPIPKPKAEDLPKLKKACEGILKQDKGFTYQDCLFNVLTTGNTGFAKTYGETLSVRPGTTKTSLLLVKNLFLYPKNRS